MANRARDWPDQTKRDLEHARHDLHEGYQEWACFNAQQSAEKALKALYQHFTGEAWRHSVKYLLEGLPPEAGVAPE